MIRALAAALVLTACSARASIPPPRTPLAATPASALAPPPSEPWPEPPFEMRLSSHRLENGLRVIVAPSHEGEGVASVVFVTRGGALYDTRARPAVTHAMARLLLRATSVEGAIVEDYLEEEGFRPSATPGDEGLLVHSVIEADALPRYLAALDRTLTSPAIRPADLQRVREDDGELIDARLETPYGVLDDLLVRMLYAEGDPRSYSLGQWLDDLRAMTVDDVRARHAQLLDPTQCAIVITGDVEPSEALPLAGAAFGDWPASPSAPIIEPPRPPSPGPRGLGILRPLMRSYVRLVERAPGLSDPDHAAFLVIEQLLGGMFTARLNLRIREHFAASYGVHARYAASSTGGQIEIETAIEPAHARGIVRALVMELRRMRGEEEGGIEPAELAIAKTRAREVLLGRTDTTLGLASVIAQWTLAGQDPSALPELLRAIDGLDASAVHAAARRWLRPYEAPVAVVGGDEVLADVVRGAGVGDWIVLRAPERRRR